MEQVETALNTFRSSFNCAQAVFSAFSEELGLDRDTALKIAACFGGGMRSGEVCGAVTGALMVLGLKWGQNIPNDTETKQKAYGRASEFLARFKRENGTILCRELLGYDLSVPEEKSKIDQLNLFDTVCPGIIESAVNIVGEMLHD